MKNMKAKDIISQCGCILEIVSRHGCYTTYYITSYKGLLFEFNTITKKGKETEFELLTDCNNRLCLPDGVFHHKNNWIHTDSISTRIDEDVVINVLKMN